MARKSKRNDLTAPKVPATPPNTPDAGRQPRIVGWLVLIAGGISSWYWYKPLPDTAKQAVHSTPSSAWPTSQSGPKSLWSDQGLVVPSTAVATDSLLEFRNEGVSQQSDESQLIGAPKVTLVPWNEVRQDIRDVLKNERIPMVPIAADLAKSHSLSHAPQVWTSDPPGANLAGNATKPNSSWPDQGYVPPAKTKKDQRRTATQITTQIPSLLETGMKSIRTTDSDESMGTSPPPNSSASTTNLTSQPEPARQPQFIRQPRKNN